MISSRSPFPENTRPQNAKMVPEIKTAKTAFPVLGNRNRQLLSVCPHFPALGKPVGTEFFTNIVSPGFIPLAFASSATHILVPWCWQMPSYSVGLAKKFIRFPLCKMALVAFSCL